MRTLLLLSLFLAMPTIATAQEACEDRPFDAQNNLAVSWEQCWFPGSTATSWMTFNCNPTPTVNQTRSLHFQFKAPFTIASTVTATATIDFVVNSGVTIVPYYRYDPSGCAGSGAIKGLAVRYAPPAISGCTSENGFDPFCSVDGSECTATAFTYSPDVPKLGVGRLVVSMTREYGRQLDYGINYYLLTLDINNRLRNDCAGCVMPVAVIWQRLSLESDQGERAVCLTGPDSPKGPDRAGLNGGDIDRPSPVAATTWGQIKALFR